MPKVIASPHAATETPASGPADHVEQVIRSSRASGLIRGLQVSVNQEQVVVTGRTETYYAKQLVTHAVLETIDGRKLCNEIEVC